MEDPVSHPKSFYAALAHSWPGLIAHNPIGPKAVAAAVRFSGTVIPLQKADLGTLMREAARLEGDWE